MGILIGLTGLARHGKGAVAAHLVEHHGFVKMSFADEVKAMARRIDPIVDWNDEPIYLSEAFGWANGDENVVKANFPEYRRFLQRLGTEGVRTIAPTFWIEALKTRIHVHQHVNKVSRIVVDDVRFPNEAAMFLDLWQVSRPGYDAVRDLHESEQHVGKLGETLHLKNDGTLGDLGILVDAVVKPMLLQESK